MSLDGPKPYLLSFWLVLSIQWPSLQAQPNFFTNGSAISVSEHCYRLTSDQISQDVGSIWSEVSLDLNHAFEIRFALNLGCRNRVGEGMAFVLHDDPSHLTALSCSGAGLGFASTRTDCNTLLPSLALEVDVRQTTGHRDAAFPHLALVKNGDQANPLVAPIRPYARNKTLLDCEYHQFRITWKPSKQEFQVFVDDQLRMTYKSDLTNRIFNGKSEVYFGFTGATSQQAALQMVCIQSVMMELDETFEQKRQFEQSVGIYTNPAREKLTIDIRLEQEQYLEVQLFDHLGRLVYEIPPHLVRQNQYYVNLPGLPSGVYFITVTNGNQRISRKITHVANMRA